MNMMQLFTNFILKKLQRIFFSFQIRKKVNQNPYNIQLLIHKIVNRCLCSPGYTGNGFICNNINECSDEGTCGPHSICKDTLGSFHCSCQKGFTGNFSEGCAGSCKDIDECRLHNSICGPQAECRNTIGSFECNCRYGYIENDMSCERKS